MKNDKVKRLLYQSIEVIWGANLAWVGKSGNKELFDLETASLVHGDLETGLGNVILEGKQITGIVDMENVKATDPVVDFAYFHFIGGNNNQYFEALKSGYDDQNLFDKSFMKKLYLYQLLHSFSLAAYYHKRGKQKSLKRLQNRIPIIEAEIDKMEINI